jgi:hypothetical protein
MKSSPDDPANNRSNGPNRVSGTLRARVQRSPLCSQDRCESRAHRRPIEPADHDCILCTIDDIPGLLLRGRGFQQTSVLHPDRTVRLLRDLDIVRDENHRVAPLLRERGQQVDDFRARA